MIPCNEIGICLGSPKIELAPSDTVSVDRARPEDWANPEDKVVLLYVLQTLHVRVHSLRLYCFILVFG